MRAGLWASAAMVTGVAAAVMGETLPGWGTGYDVAVAGVKPVVMNLYEGAAPKGGTGGAATRPENHDGVRVWDVEVPGVVAYLPTKEQLAAHGGVCVIACPGGGYTHLTRLVGVDHCVERFVPEGIAVVGLKYRVRKPIDGVEEDAVLDGKQAVRLVRKHAAEWGIDPHKVGMLGWSAGGNLILSLCSTLKETEVDARPDFVVMWSPWPNGKTNEAYPIHGKMPPLLIGSAKDDKTAPFAFAEGVVKGWEGTGSSVTFLTQEKGGHGAYELGVGTGGNWDKEFLGWLEKQGMWRKAP